MAVRTEAPPGRTPLGIVEGPLPDQRALSAVLGRLYDLHLPLVSVELLDE